MRTDHLKGFEPAGWVPAPDSLLYHGTTTTFLQTFEQDGIRSPSYWGTERVARYFAAANCREHGGRPLLMSVRLDRLDAARIHPDEDMVEFPIFPDYDERQYEWEEQGEQDWSESLRLYEAVIYRSTVPWSLITRL